MKKNIIFLFLLLPRILPAQDLIISLKNNSAAEVQTKEQLLRLVKQYAVSKWIFTHTIIVEEKSIPHSHPILTLSTRHIKDDELLLSTFLHEQFHWYLSAKRNETIAAVAALKILFPIVPTGYPEGGVDEESTYTHILVCALEYSAIRQIFGELKARQVMDFFAHDHYRWIYRTVLEHAPAIYELMRNYKL